MGKLRFEEILNYSQRFETVHPCFTIVREEELVVGGTRSDFNLSIRSLEWTIGPLVINTVSGKRFSSLCL